MSLTSGEQAFINSLYGLVGAGDQPTDRATLAGLRRGLGKEPGSVPEVSRQVYRYLPDEALEPEIRNRFLIATLFGLHPRPAPSANETLGDLGHSLALLVGRLGEDRRQGIERRFKALLSARVEGLPVHLRQMVTLLHANEVPIDYARLLGDLRWWESQKRTVQRQWARSFWSDKNSNSQVQSDGESDTPETS